MTSDARLATLMAQRGIGSRRTCAAMIRAGDVRVNGQVVLEPGLRVDPDVDAIRVHGKGLPPQPPLIYVVLNKPRGFLVTRDDPEERPTVFDLLKRIRWPVEPVGRLDGDTEGVLLLTTDGQLAAALAHPKNMVERVYLAKVAGPVSESTVERMALGRRLEDGYLKPRQVRIHSRGKGSTWIRIGLVEGRNHAVRRYLAAFRHPVLKLKRIRFGPLSTRGLPVGGYRVLEGEEVHRLREEPQKARERGERVAASEREGAKAKSASRPPRSAGAKANKEKPTRGTRGVRKRGGPGGQQRKKKR